MTRPLAAVLVAASAATAAAQPCYPVGAPVMPPGLATGAYGGGYPVSSSGQPMAPAVASGYAALPPDSAALDRLRLKTEWTAYLPLQGKRDGVGLVQAADETQVFVQTRSGLLVAVDARTGGVQWTYRYPTGYAALFPVAVTDRYVFAVNVARLIGVQRYTGAIEFNLPLPGSATAGPAAGVAPTYVIQNGVPVKIGERAEVYVVLNANRVVSYPVPVGGPVGGPVTVAPLPPLSTAAVAPPPPLPPAGYEPPASATASRTPSLAALPIITPPYTLYGRQLARTVSLQPLPSVVPPYTLRPDYLKTTQRTPSIAVLPPSAVKAFELANLVRREQELTPTWVYGSTARLAGSPVFSPSAVAGDAPRVWVGTDGATLTGIGVQSGRPVVPARLEDAAAGPLAGPAVVGRTVLGFVPLADGNVIALDLARGGATGPVVEWRAGVGGVPNRQPVPTPDAVYVGGDNAGVTKVDIRTGEVLWRTAAAADRLLAVGGEFVYIRDRAGNLLLYPKGATTAGDRQIDPVGRLGLAAFNVPVTNDRTDRVLLAADNGLLVSLRDADPKYAAATRISPPTAPPVQEVVPPPAPPAAEPPPPPEPKKDEPKKEAPKKDEPKADAPKNDAPKKDEPKAGAPKKDEPK